MPRTMPVSPDRIYSHYSWHACFVYDAAIDEHAVRTALSAFGQIVEVQLHEALPKVRFATHDEALAARSAGAVTGVCHGVDTLYNERSYDGRRGEEGREDDDGRGW